VGLLAAAALVCAAPAAGNAGELGHSGRWITDDRGRVVVLHGFNLVPKSAPHTAASVGFDDDDAAFLASEGFNAVRLGVGYASVEPAPGQYDAAYIEEVRRTVRMLARHDIFVLLDFHQDMYNERYSGHGFPDWATIDDGLAAEPDFGHPTNYFVMPALQRAYESFWANRAGPDGVGLQDHFAAAWRRVAERLAYGPNVLGYDLLNEPWPGSGWTGCLGRACGFDSGQLTPFARRVTAAIREVDPRSLVWYEPNQLFNVGSPTSHGGTGDPRAGFSYHTYCGDSGCDRKVSANAAAQAARFGDALMITEFGATDDLGILDRVADEADRVMVSWQNWTYYNAQSGGRPVIPRTKSIIVDPLLPPTADNVNQDKLDVLARPFPRLVAGTPEEWSFDEATRTFDLTYSTATVSGRRLPPGARTEVFLPARHYPQGYEVQLEGARTVGYARDGVLKLRALPRAERVHLTVTPAL
jgi:endoglycosylceramidase